MVSEFAGFDLDRSTERAWSRFQARLADHVADMQDDDVLVVAVESAFEDDDEDGSAPYVQFCAWGETLVRSEVSSNEYLAVEHLLDAGSVRTLEELGWQAPTEHPDAANRGSGSANFFLDVERAQADRLAVMTTRALRDVFGVPHPAFLSAENLAHDEVPDLGLPSRQVQPVPGADDEAVATVPRDADHLKELVDAALTPFFGHAPEHDEDDDIPVVSGSALVFVRVMERIPAIQLFATLVHDVSDTERAEFEVAVLNRDIRFLKFVLVEGDVMAYLHLPALPFAPEHLRLMLAMMAEAVDEVDDDLVRRVGGRRAFEPAETPDDDNDDEDGDLLFDGADIDEDADFEPQPDDDPIHPAMMTLLQLDADTPGSLSPELALSVCEHDRDLLLELIGWNSRQEIAWRQARDEAMLRGDGEEALVCDGEAQHAAGSVDLLRKALRLLVEQLMGRERPGRGYGDARTGRARRPSRPRPQDPLPGLGPEEPPALWDE